jgi:hypothetical protein
MVSGGYQSPTSSHYRIKPNFSLCLHCKINSNQNLPILMGIISHLHIMLPFRPCALASKMCKFLPINLGRYLSQQVFGAVARVYG